MTNCRILSFVSSIFAETACAKVVFILENKGCRNNFENFLEKIPKMLQMLRSQNPSLVQYAAFAQEKAFSHWKYRENDHDPTQF